MSEYDHIRKYQNKRIFNSIHLLSHFIFLYLTQWPSDKLKWHWNVQILFKDFDKHRHSSVLYGSVCVCVTHGSESHAHESSSSLIGHVFTLTLQNNETFHHITCVSQNMWVDTHTWLCSVCVYSQSTVDFDGAGVLWQTECSQFICVIHELWASAPTISLREQLDPGWSVVLHKHTRTQIHTHVSCTRLN